MKNALKKGLIIGAAGTALSVLGHHFLTKKMMKIAMDRVEPQDRNKGKDRLAGSPEMMKITELVEAAALQLENNGCEQVQIVAHDGVHLVGHWHLCEHPKRIVVAMRATIPSFLCFEDFIYFIRCRTIDITDFFSVLYDLIIIIRHPSDYFCLHAIFS